MILSILIPSLRQRSAMLDILLQELEHQIGDKDIEILVDRSGNTTGTKRNNLLHAAKGEYVCFIDDDDAVSHRYIDIITEALATKPDCVSLVGQMTVNGKNPKQFIHSVKYDKYFERNHIYFRPPNHLNAIRAEIAKAYKFPSKSFGEDTDWAMQICNDGAIKTEVEVSETLYYYQYKNAKWK